MHGFLWDNIRQCACYHDDRVEDVPTVSKKFERRSAMTTNSQYQLYDKGNQNNFISEKVLKNQALTDFML